MKQYLFLLQGKVDLDYAPEELQKRLEIYRNWVETVKDHYVSDNRLERSGALIDSPNQVSMDGPFLESKEIIAGFIIMQAENLSEAIDLAKTSPLLHYFKIIVRPMV